MMDQHRRATWVVALCLLAACGDSAGDGGGMPSAEALLPCPPGALFACPCIGGGMGTQTCASDGLSYLPCAGCPAVAGSPSLPMPDAGTEGPTLMAPDASLDAGMMPPIALPDASVALGPSCGVGLPIVCELGVELCCVRSLETDTCVAVDDPKGCACDLQGCDVLEVHCDGPEDCAPGETCCGTLGNGNAYVSFLCANSCNTSGNQRQACHEGIDECPGGDVCANSQLLTNVQVCIDPSTIEQ